MSVRVLLSVGVVAMFSSIRARHSFVRNVGIRCYLQWVCWFGYASVLR